jgi:hypothetical protein
MKTPVVTSASRGWNLALLALATIALAATTTSAQTVTSVGQVGDGGAATGWTNTNCASVTNCGSGPGNNGGSSLGYNFAYSSVADAKSPGGNGISGIVEMDSALTTDSACTSCGLLALEADNYNRAAIDYTFATVAGQTYTVSLDIGGTQQSGFSGAIDVLLGITGNSGVSESYNTGAEPSPPAPFTGWENETFSFVASGPSETLAFLANSAPGYIGNQDPAFAVIDDLTVSGPAPIPEPNSLILLGTGLAGLGGLVRSRFKKATV